MSLIFTALAVLFAVYGVCVLSIRSGSRFYIIWFLLAVFMLLLSRGDRFPGGIRKILVILAIASASVVAVTWVCIFTAFDSQGEEGLDYILVLGAQVRESGPSAVLRYRLDRAYAYLQKNPETVCIVSGGRGSNEPASEAEVMKNYLEERGISEDRILIEDEAENTAQNIAYSGELMNVTQDRIGIITNNFHVFRAVQIAKKAGYQHVCGIAAPSNGFYLPNNMLRETFGIAKDLVTGNM